MRCQRPTPERCVVHAGSGADGERGVLDADIDAALAKAHELGETEMDDRPELIVAFRLDECLAIQRHRLSRAPEVLCHGPELH